MNEYETTRTCKIYINNGIIHITIFDGFSINYEDALDINQSINKITTNKKHLRLIDVREKCNIDEKAKRFLESRTAKSKISREAILIGNNTKQELINYFTEVKYRRMPIKVFEDYDCAIEWLSASSVNSMKSLEEIDSLYQSTIQMLPKKEKMSYCKNLIDKTQFNLIRNKKHSITESIKNQLQELIFAARAELHKLNSKG